MKYYKVTCPAGHAGTKQHRELTLAIMAENMIEAMDNARKFPMVKHQRSIITASEITKAEYNEMMKHSAYKDFENLRHKPRRKTYY